jgi:hypothetical protein
MKKNVLGGFFLLTVLLWVSLPARAATEHTSTGVTYLYDYIFAADDNNDDYPVGEVSPPWLRATFEETDSDAVTLTLNSDGLPDDSSFVTDWYFNLDSSLDVTKLDIAFDEDHSSSDITFLAPASQEADNLSIPGDGYYDIKLSFQVNNSSEGRFYGDRTAVFSITYPENLTPLTALSFDFLSVPRDNGLSYLTAAKVQGLQDNDWSVSIGATGQPVPEPATLLLLGIGLLCFPHFIKRLKQT